MPAFLNASFFSILFGLNPYILNFEVSKNTCIPEIPTVLYGINPPKKEKKVNLFIKLIDLSLQIFNMSSDLLIFLNKNDLLIIFEKNNPEFGHVQFVHSLANLKAKCYKIPGCNKFYTLEFVGKIAPILITSTSVVGGFMCLQMIGIKVLIRYYIIRIDFVSIGLFLIFALFPFDKIKYNFIISIIKQITSYTRGVYYLHPEIHSIFKYNLKVIKNRELKGCIVNYIIFLFNLLFWFKNI